MKKTKRLTSLLVNGNHVALMSPRRMGKTGLIRHCFAQEELKVKPTSGGFIKKFHLTSASAVQRSLSALQEKDIVTNNNGQYYIYDYFLHLWLNKR